LFTAGRRQKKMDAYKIPIGQFGEWVMVYTYDNLKPIFTAFKVTAELTVDGFELLFSALPALAWIAIVAVVVWRLKGWPLAVFAIVSLLIVDNQGLWDATTLTASIVLTSTIFSLAVAMPLGILMAEYRPAEVIVEPFLDFLITIPRFVILIPAVVLLGIGVGPAIFATMTLAVAPPARITAVGLKQVDAHIVEAAHAFGANRLQILTKVKLPLALPSLVLAVNQCLLMSLVMAVIAAFIGAGGLGENILSGIMLLNSGQGFVAGFGVFALAILLDRTMRAIVDKMLASPVQPAAEKG
jgi:ABC-type proline/glycine betaine transport system permease subunit